MSFDGVALFIQFSFIQSLLFYVGGQPGADAHLFRDGVPCLPDRGLRPAPCYKLHGRRRRAARYVQLIGDIQRDAKIFCAPDRLRRRETDLFITLYSAVVVKCSFCLRRPLINF